MAEETTYMLLVKFEYTGTDSDLKKVEMIPEQPLVVKFTCTMCNHPYSKKGELMMGDKLVLKCHGACAGKVKGCATIKKKNYIKVGPYYNGMFLPVASLVCSNMEPVEFATGRLWDGFWGPELEKISVVLNRAISVNGNNNRLRLAAQEIQKE